MANTTDITVKKLQDRIESYEIELQLSEEDKQRFMNNPIDFMKDQLERKGYTVRRIIADKNALIRHISGGPRASFEWMHTAWAVDEDRISEWRYTYIESE